MVSLGRWGDAVKDIEGAPLLMMFGCMVFAGVVGSVEDAFAPEVLELLLSILAFEPVERWSMDLEALGVTVPMVRPWAVMLLVVTGVGLGWV